ncbi:ankyrin repeat domain-containing protein 17 isoform X2 [Harpegnathos saltator]|uniref:ankyrin repeat domain-containing protein 17 isoform X2 n=1 Tax=Harpegnathos saltator TaxID=610380 RepID=UPI000DBEE4E1|nr:ankyrin repeat domain-containing protein 17 isoform X2 [Harpegnathos saltator]
MRRGFNLNTKDIKQSINILSAVIDLDESICKPITNKEHREKMQEAVQGLLHLDLSDIEEKTDTEVESNLTSLLLSACASGYYELVQELITRNVQLDINRAHIKENCTALMEAARAGHANIVHLLLSHGADVDARSSTKNSALIYGCAGGYEEVAAAKAGYVPIAKILLEHGAMCKTQSSEFKETALTLASYKGHLEMVRLLLEADASQKYDINDLNMALVVTSIGGYIEVARLLLDSGAQVDTETDSAESSLLLAAWRGHTELVKLLLDRGANINKTNIQGYNSLMQASRAGHMETVALLLSEGAIVNTQNNKTSETALILACHGGFLRVVEYLIKTDIDINMGYAVYTPLIKAAQAGHIDVVRYLLNCAAEVEIQSDKGKTALTYACENGHTDIVTLLLTFNANLEHETKEGATPLILACIAGHFDLVQYLMTTGVNINYQTEFKYTALTMASISGHAAIVALLLDHGAVRQYEDEDGLLTAEVARNNQPYTINLLLDKPRIFRTYAHNYSTNNNNESLFQTYALCWEDMKNREQLSYMKRETVKTALLEIIAVCVCNTAKEM